MRRALVLALVLAVVAAAVASVYGRAGGRGYSSTRGSTVIQLTLRSKLLGRPLHEVLVLPPNGGRGRPLLVFLHGRGAKPDFILSDRFFEALRVLGRRAPDVLLADGGDHSYWHDRRDGRWGSSVLREAIPAALARLQADPKRVAIGGVSMGGFGALDLARLSPARFCAVGGHSAALWARAGDTAAGAFDDAADFARHDVIGAARLRSPYDVPVWLDVGTVDPFRAADTQLATELKAHGARVSFHVWPGGHDDTYWQQHVEQYLRFYADACG